MGARLQVLTVQDTLEEQSLPPRARVRGGEQLAWEGRYLLWLLWVMCAELVGDETALGC